MVDLSDSNGILMDLRKMDDTDNASKKLQHRGKYVPIIIEGNVKYIPEFDAHLE